MTPVRLKPMTPQSQIKSTDYDLQQKTHSNFPTVTNPLLHGLVHLFDTYRISKAATSLNALSSMISTWLLPRSRVVNLTRLANESTAIVPMLLRFKSLQR